jgi:Glycosyl hydrolase family 9.
MLTMQDKDGGVYHKVTTLKFGGSVLPENDVAPRYAIIKNVTASLDFAAVMAQASVVYRNIDKAYADKMLKAAESAYAWAKKNPEAFYKQPDDVQTGSYMPGDENGKDEFRWAAAELFRASKKAEYQEDLKTNAFTPDGAWWGNVNMLSAFRVALDSADFEKELVDAAKKVVLNEANNLRAVGDTSAYRLPASRGAGTGAATARWRTTGLCWCMLTCLLATRATWMGRSSAWTTCSARTRRISLT